MDPELLADRRRIRRKLSFWRIMTVVVSVALVAGLVWRFQGAARDSNHIARIDIDGVITDDQPLLDLIKDVAENDAAKALIVSISSPGGTTYGGERLHKALLAAGKSKPVVADIHTLAASAGYMIAVSTDHIVAGESSIVGSIGVLFQYAQAGELLDKIGIRLEAIKSSPMKAEPSPFHEASDEAKAMIRSMVLDSYDWFVDMVAARREMDRTEVLALADGSIFTGRQGLKNGLVDALGGDAEIRAYLKGRNVDDTLKIVDWKPADSTTGLLFGARAASLLQQFIGVPETFSNEINRLADGKLFLDGLVSVWQVGGHSESGE
ncbi:signal peptide peptidase SppA [Hoeflea sp. YIM 152468]|uniref:signal peptide peptidase SppA n=1 Tax=Hoeflea sp. YIM 152468 TaxID=3031759 RepID=UPI0023DB07D3|nr:signal peptide peptidase SppA [Hoeflea sp. YIM 152468]MDF1608314.1 signal peptide peptidase SppA [Hoeflea sp. YIM 152468]